MSFLIFIVILAVLIFVHELGHFLVAKKSGIKVSEFALGFPPRLFSFTRGETTYSLNLIPFGGYVKIFGENPDQESIEGPEAKERSFFHKPKYIQAAVLVAGVTFNIIFAWLLISIGFMSGLPSPVDSSIAGHVRNAEVVITSISKDSPASLAGLKEGDRLLSLQSGKDSLQKPTVLSVQDFVATHGGKEIDISYKRGKEILQTKVIPKEGLIANKYAIGVSMDMIGILQLPPHKALYEAGKLTVLLIKSTAIGLAGFLWNAVTFRADFSQVTGPVGIVSLVGGVSQLGFVYLLSFAAFISINLAVINLIPFPALDGGRLLFVLIKAIKGSPIKPSIANTMNGIGFVLLIILMLAVTFHDILNLF